MYEPKFAQGPLSLEFCEAVVSAVKNLNSETDIREFAIKVHDAVLVARSNDDGLQSSIKVIEQ